jgi:hypothetical protein
MRLHENRKGNVELCDENWNDVLVVCHHLYHHPLPSPVKVIVPSVGDVIALNTCSQDWVKHSRRGYLYLFI